VKSCFGNSRSPTVAEHTAIYVATRRALLDALDALRRQSGALILVGAQAVFVHTGDVDEAVVTETKDADLAVDPTRLSDEPLLEAALRSAGFHLDIAHPQPGSWISPDGYPVDLLIPEAASGRIGSGRSGRIPPHDKMATRRVRGIEGALVDHAPMTVAALDPDDTRAGRVNVAGPAALLVAKVHKVAERAREPERQRPRDAHDVYRLLRETEPAALASGFARMRADDLSAPVTNEAITLLGELFAAADSIGAQQVAEAVAPLVSNPAVIANATAALTTELLDLLR